MHHELDTRYTKFGMFLITNHSEIYDLLLGKLWI
ncbi:hypothetical protein [Photobacterium leiognathi]